jgi:hypothetical protein
MHVQPPMQKFREGEAEKGVAGFVGSLQFRYGA